MKEKIVTLLTVSLLILAGLSSLAGGQSAADSTAPVEGASVNLAWTDGTYTDGNSTSTNATGYYEMNVAEGTVNITVEHSDTQENETLNVKNFTGNFTVADCPSTYWKNITLPAFPQDNATLVGTVYDNSTGDPVEADISISFTGSYFTGSNSTTCATDGSYSIDLPPSEVTVTADATGYYSASNTTTIGEETKTLNVYLEPEPPETATVKGYVTNSDNGTGIENMFLYFSSLNSSYSNYTYSNADGYYECDLAAENFSISPYPDEYFSNSTMFELNDSEVKWVNMSFIPTPPDNAWVEGHVYDNATGSPLANAGVSVSGSSRLDFYNYSHYFNNGTMTNSSGYYNVSIPAVEAVELYTYYKNKTEIYSIYAYKADYFDNSSSGDIIEPGGVMVRDINLTAKPPENCIVKGYINQSGAPSGNTPPSASFTIEPGSISTGETVYFNSTSTDSDGSIASWSWEFGDGSTATGAEVTHSYSDDGSYTVNLTVADDDGASDTASETVTVGADIYVDDDAPDSWYDATHVHTIQEGVDNATAGDTILTEPGEYEENIDIYRSNITLRSSESHEAVINGSVEITADGVTVEGMNITNADYYELPQNSGTVGIYVNQSEDGFEVDLRDNRIAGADYGIYIRDKNEGHGGLATIEGNDITDIEEHAIFFHAHGTYTVEHVTVTNNTITDSVKGIKIYACDQSIIETVTVENNTFKEEKSDKGHAIRVHAGGGWEADEYGGRIDAVTIDNNIVIGEIDSDQGHGIRVHSGYLSRGIGSVDITDNVVEYPGEQGIRVQLHGNSTEEGVTITDNEVTGNDFTKKGIRVDTASSEPGHIITLKDVVVENNLVTEIDGSDKNVIGIRVKAGGYDDATHIENVSVIGNEVTDGAGEGIRVQTGGIDENISTMGTVIVENNTVTDNEERGIRVHAGAGNYSKSSHPDSYPTGSSIDTAIVEGNIVIDNGVIGVRVSAGNNSIVSTATIEDNYVEGHKVGIWDRACDEGIIKSLTIDENEVKKNTEFGILLDDGSWECPRSGRTNPSGAIESVNVTKNMIEGNGAGVFVFDINGDTESAVTINYNNISNNTWGIQVHETYQDDIVDNEFWYNGDSASGNGGAINLSRVNDTYLSGNTLRYNYHGVWMENCEDNLVEYNDIQQTLPDCDGSPSEIPPIGVVIVESDSFNVIQHNNVSSYPIGIALAETTHEKVRYNDVSFNMYGVLLAQTSLSNIIGNEIYSNSEDGVLFQESDHNNLTGNHIYDNTIGVNFTTSPYNNLTGNDILNNADKGIHLYMGSSYNNLTENYVADNNYGIYLEGSSTTLPENITIRDCVASGNAEHDFFATDHTVNTTVTNLTVSSYPTSVDFTYGYGIALKGVAHAELHPNPGYADIGKFLNITNVTATSWINISIHYEEDDLDQTDEDTLMLHRLNDTSWELANPDYEMVNTADNYLRANLSEFSIFGVFGDFTRYWMNLSEGWNMVTLPVWNSSFVNAQDLGEWIPDCTMVSRWNPQEQMYVTHVVGYGSGFNLVNGSGYFVYVTADVSKEYTGMGQATANLTVMDGYNLLGWTQTIDTNASALLASIENCLKLGMYDPEDGWLPQYFAGSPAPLNFEVVAGDGVFVYVTTGSSTWNGS